ncbi:hypothetical protein WN51_00887 [Melipona quadrifasciata]|uniref:Uncharacterized protein n=1 Tax=Melipona quadrifasciata TaxID=166423 RepID=A0A0M9ADK8_9HYME|nr:hypothetical protein WN51_00887 [Melipona quadrifasciata]
MANLGCVVTDLKTGGQRPIISTNPQGRFLTVLLEMPGQCRDPRPPELSNRPTINNTSSYVCGAVALPRLDLCLGGLNGTTATEL